MALTGKTVTVGTTPTLVVDATAAPKRCNITVDSGATETVHFGDSNVTTSDGFQIEAGSTVEIDVPQGDQLHGIAAASTDVHVLETA